MPCPLPPHPAPSPHAVYIIQLSTMPAAQDCLPRKTAWPRTTSPAGTACAARRCARRCAARAAASHTARRPPGRSATATVHVGWRMRYPALHAQRGYYSNERVAAEYGVQLLEYDSEAAQVDGLVAGECVVGTRQGLPWASGLGLRGLQRAARCEGARQAQRVTPCRLAPRCSPGGLGEPGHPARGPAPARRGREGGGCSAAALLGAVRNCSG